MAIVNDFLSKGELFYDENSTNIPAEVFKASEDYRVVANKDLVGGPYPVDGIYNEDPVATTPTTPVTPPVQEDQEESSDGDDNA